MVTSQELLRRVTEFSQTNFTHDASYQNRKALRDHLVVLGMPPEVASMTVATLPWFFTPAVIPSQPTQADLILKRFAEGLFKLWRQWSEDFDGVGWDLLVVQTIGIYTDEDPQNLH